jgi:homogentisate solanesyltransferase
MELSFSPPSSLGISALNTHRNTSSHQPKIPIKPTSKSFGLFFKSSNPFPSSTEIYRLKRSSKLAPNRHYRRNPIWV